MKILEFLRDKKFFKQIVHEVLTQCLKQQIQVVELRHNFGCLTDENQDPVPIEEELKIIEDTVKHIQMDYPDFRARIIVTGSKFLGYE